VGGDLGAATQGGGYSGWLDVASDSEFPGGYIRFR
jgi:hypothetical protein